MSIRSPTRPGPAQPAMLLLGCLYLSNHKSDWKAVFFAKCPHLFCPVSDQCPVTLVFATARGAFRVRGVQNSFSQEPRNDWAECVRIGCAFLLALSRSSPSKAASYWLTKL